MILYLSRMKFFTTDLLLQNGVSIYICCRQWRQTATASLDAVGKLLVYRERILL